ncbi:protein FAR-RED ELONGATED HYPOCOTYL 3-like [Dorcoceras hygrometricum]|uniref:Protein FAR-RED ELONGATED HYPOCOTYL 3-like n=1 Tax=Dorcoceras hygrometricum TaxID=472368 RepID=A0A2Z7CHN2_9LAMI|nr:protein FAR-RED ELONGATED HYPOCOTYL 3-like [Dorcoceras hygrometricum]
MGSNPSTESNYKSAISSKNKNADSMHEMLDNNPKTPTEKELATRRIGANITQQGDESAVLPLALATCHLTIHPSRHVAEIYKINPYLNFLKEQSNSLPAQICPKHNTQILGKTAKLTANFSRAHGWKSEAQTSLHSYPINLTGSLKQVLEQDLNLDRKLPELRKARTQTATSCFRSSQRQPLKWVRGERASQEESNATSNVKNGGRNQRGSTGEAHGK